MARDWTFEAFLEDFAARIGAAAVVLGIFFGLGYLNRTDVLGLSRLLGTRLGFFVAAFLMVGVASVGWIAFQRNRE